MTEVQSTSQEAQETSEFGYEQENPNYIRIIPEEASQETDINLVSQETESNIVPQGLDDQIPTGLEANLVPETSSVTQPRRPLPQLAANPNVQSTFSAQGAFPQQLSANALGMIRSVPSVLPVNQGQLRVKEPLISDDNCVSQYPTGTSEIRPSLSFLENEAILNDEEDDENISLDSLPDKVISKVTISLFSIEEMERIKVCDVVDPSKETKPGTVNDPKMGVVYNYDTCTTCNQDIDCPGHYGLIRFNAPIYHPEYIRNLVSILNCVCVSCGTLLLDRDYLETKGILRFSRMTRLKVIELESKGKPCRRDKSKLPGQKPCDPNPEFVPAQSNDKSQMVFRIETKLLKNRERIAKVSTGEKSAKEYYYGIKPIAEVIHTLSTISENDAGLLGFTGDSHPKRMIMQGILVMAPINRPPDVEKGVETPNPLTIVYSEIVKDNIAIKEAQLGLDPKLDVKSATDRLFQSVRHLIDNSDGGYQNTRGIPFISIKGRIQGKGSDIRGNLMGKRSNFTARVVIGASNVPFGKIRIPRILAPVLTKPMRVFRYNIDAIRSLLDQGKITHITYASGKLAGKRIKVKEGMKYRIEEGDKVDRWLQSGDFIIFNRQPTLHKYSMMAYEVVLGDYINIGLNLVNTSPHNADFEHVLKYSSTNYLIFLLGL